MQDLGPENQNCKCTREREFRVMKGMKQTYNGASRSTLRIALMNYTEKRQSRMLQEEEIGQRNEI
jgi:hypothetical protein